MARILALGILTLVTTFSLIQPLWAKNELRVMSYNVENLFDTAHDEGKSDWDFLPKGYPGKKEGCLTKSPKYRAACLNGDWTEDKLRLKLDQIKKVVLQGERPDILAIEEVENEVVLKRLAQTLGFDQYVLEEGPDHRGIDVALLYDSSSANYISHRVHRFKGDEFDQKPTRDILGVYFQLDSQNVLAVYVNHWPSQAAPATKRFKVAQELKNMMEEDRQKYGKNFHGIATGDFNTVDSDWPHPHKGVLESRAWKNYLLDLRELAEDRGSLKNGQPLGTYFFPPKMSWNYLDKFFVTQNLFDKNGVEVVLSSFNVRAPEFAADTYEYRRKNLPLYGSKVSGVPLRYNHKATSATKAGFSDHYPIEMRIKY
ncbi:MAG: hypothetical protein H6626_08930 [Pseudobdellovibrionaceae bacterium]|nr:hypothetical protein [Bdellovibrionales bacterium]USN46340.1 MAG: hypothetical protein H6626_08930 [Pseudobdellovibrionaceae bacterium]